MSPVLAAWALRLKAQLTNVTQLAKTIGMDRSAYLDWEKRKTPLTHVDFVLLTNALALFGCTYEEVSDPMPTSSPQPVPRYPATKQVPA